LSDPLGLGALDGESNGLLIPATSPLKKIFPVPGKIFFKGVKKRRPLLSFSMDGDNLTWNLISR
jgi:hypothetical protein